MRAWRLSPLRFGSLPDPSPAPGELLLRVRACGVCRTDLHLLDGDLPPRRPGVVPGHEVVGEVVASEAEGFVPGDRVGVAWLRSTCGACRYCRRGAENLCPASLYTGWDADGGYAEMCLVPAAFAHSLPSSWDGVRLAPLLCAGIIGYRALKLADVPPGGRLGIWGFGGSAHLAAQVAMAQGASVHVVTRSPRARSLALSLGADSASESSEGLPPLDSGIIFAPAGTLVPPALRALDRGGTLAIAGIHLTDVPVLSYRRDLYGERRLLSVTSNTRQDAAEFLTLAERLDLHVETDPRPLAEAAQALADLSEGRVRGAAVLVP